MNFNEVLRIAQQAWDKTKSPFDPVWNKCDATHRQMFAAKAEAVINTEWAVDDFEHAVLKLAGDAKQKQRVIDEAAADNPGAHSDEIQLEAARRQGLIPPEPSPAPMAVAASASVGASAEPQVAAAEVQRKRSHSKAKPKGGTSKKSSKKNKE